MLEYVSQVWRSCTVSRRKTSSACWKPRTGWGASRRLRSGSCASFGNTPTICRHHGKEQSQVKPEMVQHTQDMDRETAGNPRCTSIRRKTSSKSIDQEQHNEIIRLYGVGGDCCAANRCPHCAHSLIKQILRTTCVEPWQHQGLSADGHALPSLFDQIAVPKFFIRAHT